MNAALRNLSRLVAAQAFAVLMVLTPSLDAFAAEMTQGGALETSDISNYWTIVETGDVTVVSGEAGYVDLCVGYLTPIGVGNFGNSYIYQNTTGSILSTDVVRLNLWWKKWFTGYTPSSHMLYVDIQKPSSSVARIWTHTTASDANVWTEADVDVSFYFDEDGVYEIRLGADFFDGLQYGPRTYGWFDEVSLDAAAGSDTTPPSVSITDPTGGAVIGDTYSITASATDNVAVDRVEFFYDGSLIGTDYSSPYSIQWNTTAVGDGAYSLTATAYDTAALNTTSSPVSVTVDNTDPTSLISDPPSGQPLLAATHPIIGTADDTNFSQYTLEYGVGESPASWNDIGVNPRVAPVVAGTLGTWDASALGDGIYTIRLITTDEANNSSTVTVPVEIDGARPTVVSAVGVGQALVNVVFSEDLYGGSLDSTYFIINDLTVTGAALLTDNVTARLNTSSQEPGYAYTVTVRNTAPTVEDLVGNIVGSPNTAQFSGFETDLIPPSVALTAPNNGDYVGLSPSLDAAATDNVAIDRVEFRYNAALIGIDNGFPYSVSWDTSSLPGGQYTLTATAYDTSNNSAASEPITVTLDTTDPAATITNPMAYLLIPSTSYGITGTAWDSNFLQYTLEYGAGVSPAGWNDIGTNPRTTDVISGALGVWDTSSVGDGIYTIRLVVEDMAGNSTTRTTLVSVDSASPTVASALALNPIQVDVLFSEDVYPNSVQPGYFNIDNGLAVTNAILRGDNRTVRLDTDPQAQGTTYTVIVNAATPTIEDPAGNSLGSPNTAQFSGFAGPTSIITSPTPDQPVTGIVTISGTASDPDFTEYALEYARGKDPSSAAYEDIGANPRVAPVVGGTLGVWDTSGLADGGYTIRLTTRNSTPEETAATIAVVLDNAPPVLDSARAVDGETVDLLFREHVGATLDPVYFSIPGLTISGVVRLEDFCTLRLTTSAQTPDANYTITVRSASPTVADMAGIEMANINNTADFTGYNPATTLGDGNLLRRNPDDTTCGSSTMGCHNLVNHSSDTASDTYGTWGRTFQCLTCHEAHGARNIFLIKETINTPNSGDMAVDFRTIGVSDPYNDPDPVPGAHDYSLGDATDGFNDSVCEVCHTQTSHYRNVDASTPDTDHNNDSNCVICHPHTMGFTISPSESEGGFSCSACHPATFSPMNNDTTQYHHYMDNTDPAYPVIANSSGLSASSTDKRCLMCHVDHNVFRTDLNANSSGRANNLRETIKSTVTTSSNFTNSEYSSMLPDGGICLSCHENSMTKNTAAQKDDGSTTTLRVDKTLYDAAITAHNYNVTSTFDADASTFNANCVKCHSDSMPKLYQGPSGNAFGAHASMFDRILDPLGITNPAAGDDPLEERFCYECHTGGASGDAPDYYGAATMDENSLNVSDHFSKTYAHFIEATNGLHRSDEGAALNPGWNQGANRHVECADCHNPHAAQDGLHMFGSNIIGPPLLGQWGVRPTSWGTGGTQHTSFEIVNFDNAFPGSDQYEAYLCFKCHSYYAYENNPPNTPSGNADGSAAVQTDVVTEFNPNNYAHHATAGPGNHPPHANYSQTFVAPWGPGKTVTCSNCHASETVGDPAGSHGSNNRWMLKSNERGIGSLVIFCFNCHNRDVYGDVDYVPWSASLSRITHPIHGAHRANLPVNGIWCMMCHGGTEIGGIHGSHAGPGPGGGTSPLGLRFLNGATISGMTIGTVATGGSCWTKKNADSVNTCTRGHKGTSFSYNYDL